MTPKETVEWANKTIKEKIFPTLREIATGKKIQLSENDSLLRQTIMLARERLEQYAKAEEIDLQGTEVVAYPEMVSPGNVVLNMFAVTEEEADMIRGELVMRELRRTAGEKAQEKKDDLPN